MAQSILLIASNTYQMQIDVRARILQGFCVSGGVLYENSTYYQQMMSGGTAVDLFYIVDESQDWQFDQQATNMMNNGLIPQGEIIVDGGRFIQSFTTPQPAAPVNRADVLAILNAAIRTDPDYTGLTAYVADIVSNWGTTQTVTVEQISDASVYGKSLLKSASTPVSGLSGASSFGAALLTANGITSAQITDATSFGRSVLTGNTVPVTAITPSTSFGQSLLNLSALPAPANQVFRGSYATTGATISQNIASANTPQVITFNTQTVPNAAIGTLNNATGVFTFAAAFTGDLELVFQVLRQATLLSSGTWACQVETSPDGVTWTPVNGSQRREFFQAISADQARSVALTVGISVAAGSSLRVTQMTDNVVIGVGVMAGAAAYGGTTTAGVIMSLYTVR